MHARTRNEQHIKSARAYFCAVEAGFFIVVVLSYKKATIHKMQSGSGACDVGELKNFGELFIVKGCKMREYFAKQAKSKEF